MSQELRDWLEGFSNQSAQIWCEDPETSTTVGVISKTYLTYRILMKQVGRDVVGVRHRYSEFETLRTQLKDRYAPLGILIPSLPPKSSMASLITARTGDKSFIKERTLGLTMFCESIVASPWLKNDTQWKTFMKPAPVHGGVVEIENGTSVGEAKLIECFSQLDIAYKYTMVQRMEDVKEEVLLVEKSVKSLLDKVRTVQNCEKALTAANEGVAAQLSLWLDNERNGVSSLAGRAFDENESMLKPTELVTSTLSATSILLKNKNGGLEGNPEYTGLTLATVLEQELALVESFKELFRVHEEILHSIDTVSAKLGRVEAGKAANKQEQLTELRRNLEDKQTCLTAFYKGFVYFSLPTSARQRALTLRKLTAAVASSNLTSSFVMQKCCLEYFSSLALSPGSAIASTSRMLELLGMKPLEQLPEDLLVGDEQCSDMVDFSGSIDVVFSRAVAIGKGKSASSASSAAAAAPLVESPAVAPLVASPEKTNPLAARRGSAVVNIRNQFESTAGADGEPLYVVEASPPPVPPMPPATTVSESLASLTLSDKTQSLLGELMQSEGAFVGSDPKNVWDEM